jgi:hypothetical protein
VNAQRNARRPRKRAASIGPPAKSGIKIPTPSHVALTQSRELGPKLTPPPRATDCERPPVAYVTIDESGRGILTVEGPVELEVEARHPRHSEPSIPLKTKTKPRARRDRKRP